MMTKETFSRLILPLSVVAIALIVIGGFVFLVNQSSKPQPVVPNPNPSPTPTPQAIGEIPDDWLTYSNERLGFEIRYPETLVAVCGTPHQVGTKSDPELWNVGPLSILIYNSQGLALPEFVDERFRELSPGEEIVQSEPFMKNGIEFIQVSHAYQVGVNNILEHYFAKHNDKAFEFFITVWPTNDCTAHYDITKQMIDTLAFSNK